MNEIANLLHSKARRLTLACYYGSYVLDIPMVGMFSLLSYILGKETTQASCQIAIFLSIKPVTALFSPYWSSLFTTRRWGLRGQIIWANLLVALPLLSFPFFKNSWLFVISFALYHLGDRAVIPAWMETIKQFVKPDSRRLAVGRTSFIVFLGGAFLPLLLAPYLDRHPDNWGWLYFILGLLSLARLGFQLLLPTTPVVERIEQKKRNQVLTLLIHPWSQFWLLMRERPDFAFYQLIFFFGGLGIMLTQTTVNQLCCQILKLSYTEIAIAVSLCKGLGYLVSHPFWQRRFDTANFYLFCSMVALLAGLSSALFLFAGVSIAFVYLAELCYGAMQAGSGLSWYLSGPRFAKSEDSLRFTAANVLLIGIRGLIGPSCGTLICAFLGYQAPFMVSIALCCAGALLGIAGAKIRWRSAALAP